MVFLKKLNFADLLKFSIECTSRHELSKLGKARLKKVMAGQTKFRFTENENWHTDAVDLILLFEENKFYHASYTAQYSNNITESIQIAKTYLAKTTYKDKIWNNFINDHN